MLTLRKEQVAAFESVGKKAFEDRMLAHLHRVFPDQSKSLVEAKLRELIQYGTKRAATYGIISERDVGRYIDLMILYSRDFDKDPALPWAQSVLQNQAIRDPSSRIERLYKVAEQNERKGQLR